MKNYAFIGFVLTWNTSMIIFCFTVVSTQQTQLILQETETEAIVSSKKNKTSSKTGSFKQANLRDMFLKPVNKPSKKFASASSGNKFCIV